MTKEIVKASSLIPFLNQKNKVDLKYNKTSNIERKEVVVTKAESINENDATLVCIISTQNVDRMGDVVISNGIKTDEFKKIPSVYVNHDYSLLPIASCEELIHKDGMIEAKVKFVKEDTLSMKVFNLIKAGAMKGVSIGFDAEEVILRGTKSFDDTCKSLGMDMSSYQKTQRIIKSWMMYEFSLCSIPANAECMVKALDKPEDKPEEDSKTTKPVGPFATFEACVVHMMEKEGYDKETAQKVCGKIEAEQKEQKEDNETNETNEETEKHDNDTIPAKSKESNERQEEDDKKVAKEVYEEKPEEVEENAEDSEMDKYIEEEMMDHSDVIEYLKECNLSEDHIKQVFKLIVMDELKEDPDFYNEDEEEEQEGEESNYHKDNALEKTTEEANEAKKIEVIPQVRRYIQILQTPEDIQELISKSVEARIKGKTRITIV